MEIYKNIPDYEAYQVSNLGNIRNKQTGKILKPGKCTNGYYNYGLFKNGKRTTVLAHRVVWQSFNGNTAKDIHHKNGIKTDNRLSNLDALTRKDNIKEYKNSITKCYLVVINDGKTIYSGFINDNEDFN